MSAGVNHSNAQRWTAWRQSTPNALPIADGRLRASFEIVWLSGWAPHESQQKPLKPGSAARRLADALGTREISAGEKPPRSS